MHGRIALLFICLSVFFAERVPARPPGASMLGDLYPWPAARDSSPDNIAVVGDRAFFAASTASSGREVWVTDGTHAGTRLVTDIFPGNGSSGPDYLVAIANKVLFAAQDEMGAGLWISDGSEEGTRKIAPAVAGARANFEAQRIAVVDECAWMRGNDGTTGREPWRFCLADGRLVQLADLAPGSESSDPSEFYPAAGKVFINTTRGLYVSDAQSDDLKRFAPAAGPDLRIGYGGFTLFRGFYYFMGTTAASGAELWRTDGTVAGTSQVADMMPGTQSSNPYGLTVFHGELYFSAQTPQHGHELRVSDGTAQGTRLFRDINPGAGSSGTFFLFEDNGQLYFAGVDATGGASLWRTDGSADGTVQYATPADVDLLPFIFDFTKLAGRVVFFAQSVQYGIELWGTTNNGSIQQIVDICAGPCDGISRSPVTFKDHLYFGGFTRDTGGELWRTGGTTETTRLFANLGQDDSADTEITSVAADDGVVLFSGPGKLPSDAAVWTTDGSVAGTRRLKIFSGSSDAYGNTSAPSLMGLFVTDRGMSLGVNAYDAAQTGQWVLRDGRADRIGYAVLANPARVNGKIISVATDGNLWTMTGEKGSVQRIAQLSASGRMPWPPLIAVAGNLAWFLGDAPGGGGLALWQSDGSTGGTRVASGASITNSAYDFRILGTLGESMLFLSPGGGGVVLSRASAEGVFAVKTIAGSHTQYSLSSERAAAIGDVLVFTRNGTSFVDQLWVTDGSREGTVRLAPEGDPADFRPRRPVSFQDHAYFTAFDEEHGFALWRTDGTNEGTALFADVAPGFDNFEIGHLTVHSGELYFVAATRASGDEIWKTDGKKVVQVTELLPGSLSASPIGLRSAGGLLLFRADDGVHGREPWALDAAPSAAPVADK